jgi:hypothetical protein
MKKMPFALSVCFMLFMTCVGTREQVTAQSPDPLQERLNFLKTKLQKHLTHSVREGEGPEIGNVSFVAVNFETCRIAWESSSETPTALGDVEVLNQASVDLSAIDPARTKIYVVEGMRRQNIPWSLVLELTVRPGSQGFKLQMVTTKSGRVTRIPTLVQKQHAFFFNIRDQRIVEDISKAFAEASNICRSRMQRGR